MRGGASYASGATDLVLLASLPDSMRLLLSQNHKAGGVDQPQLRR